VKHEAEGFPLRATTSRDGTALVAQLGARIDDALSAMLERGRPVALINFPNHANPGDNAIWLGALSALRRAGVPVGYVSSWSSFDARVMRHAVGDAPLVLNGGGNFGDLYAGQQQLRELVLETCRDRRIVQLPQSIAFRDPANLEKMRRLCAEHPDFTLCVRERRSYEIAQRAFDVRTVLLPDMAFALPRPQRPARMQRDLLWLARTDAERVPRDPPPPDFATDWNIGEPAAGLTARAQRILAINRRIDQRRHGGGPAAGTRRRAFAWTFEHLADAWVRRGMDLIGSSRVVVTDRLHAHVFALLLDVPHVLLDNSYGKVRSTFDTWTGSSPLVRWADSNDEAWDAVSSLGSGAARG